MEQKCIVCKNALKECNLTFSCSHFLCNACLSRELLLKKFDPLKSTNEVEMSCSCGGSIKVSYQNCLKDIKNNQNQIKKNKKCTHHNLEANDYCFDCKMWICQECKESFHDKMFPNHQVSSEDKMMKSKCFFHKNKIKNIFCKFCNDLICEECQISETHSNHPVYTLDEYKKLIKNKKNFLRFKNYEEILYFIDEKESNIVKQFIKNSLQNKKYINDAIKLLKKLNEQYTQKLNEQMRNLKNIFNILKQTYKNYYEELKSEKIDLNSYDFIDKLNFELNNIDFTSFNLNELEKIHDFVNNIKFKKFYEIKFNFNKLNFPNSQTIENRYSITSILDISSYLENSFLIGSENGYISMFQKKNKFYEKIYETRQHNGPINILKFLSKQSKSGFMSGSSDKIIKFWSFEENDDYGRSENISSSPKKENPNSFSNKNCPYKLLNFSNSSLHKGSIIALLELEDGRIVSSGSDNKIYIFRINENKNLIKIDKRVSYESCIVELDRNRIITGSLDNRVKVWDINERKLIQTFLGHTSEITCLIKKDDNTVISGSGDNSIIIWDIKNDKNIKRLIGHLDKIINIYYYKVRNRLLSISKDKCLRIWDLNELFCTNVLSNYHSSIMYDLTMCGKDIITVGNDKKIQIFDADEDDVNNENYDDEENYGDFEK